jgi:hypothetical protein
VPNRCRTAPVFDVISRDDLDPCLPPTLRNVPLS